jgi:hypothetical protein
MSIGLSVMLVCEGDNSHNFRLVFNELDEFELICFPFDWQFPQQMPGFAVGLEAVGLVSGADVDGVPFQGDGGGDDIPQIQCDDVQRNIVEVGRLVARGTGGTQIGAIGA